MATATETQIINHDLRVVNGGTLYMPPWEAGNDKWGNLDLPDVYAKSTIQKYPTGTIYRLGMRTFVYTLTDATYYGEAGTQAIGAGYLMESAATHQDKSNLVISGALAATELVVDLETGHTVNSFAGGFIGIKGQGTRQTVGRYSSFQIISNTVANAASDYQSTFQIDGALPILLTTSDDVVLTEHPYAKVRHWTSGPYGMCVGILLCTTAASNYLWLQTGGPHNMVVAGASFEGDTAYSIPYKAFGGTGNRTPDGTTSTISSIEASNMQLLGNSYASSKADGAAATTAYNTGVGEAIFLNILN